MTKKRTSSSPKTNPRENRGTRLNKYLSICGLGSRRSVEDLIRKGRIAVNGFKTSDLATLVGEDDLVTVDGNPLHPQTERLYILMHKPDGVITTVRDDRSRTTVMDLLPGEIVRQGVFPVGRLDRDTGGILLLTNDGDLAYRLTRPEYGVHKEYTVVLDRPMEEADRRSFEEGMYLPDLQIRTRPATVRCDRGRRKAVIKIHEGKNRQIRRMFDIMGYRVLSLDRTGYAGLGLRGLPRGSWRRLRPHEIEALRGACRVKAPSEKS